MVDRNRNVHILRTKISDVMSQRGVVEVKYKHSTFHLTPKVRPMNVSASWLFLNCAQKRSVDLDLLDDLFNLLSTETLATDV